MSALSSREVRMLMRISEALHQWLLYDFGSFFVQSFVLVANHASPVAVLVVIAILGISGPVLGHVLGRRKA